jgi:hypothetical protein
MPAMPIPYNACWEVEQLLAMPFDQYQRYRLTAELIMALKQAAGAQSERWRLLDVGGYYRTLAGESRLPLVDFAPDDEVRVVDLVAYEHPQYQQASGTALPFPNRAFDIVATCDTLEHVPPEGRGAFLKELRRVARRAVILAAPHATPGVNFAERTLDEYLRSFGIVHEMLDEHLRYGIPDPAWVDGWLQAHGARFVAFPSGYLPRWILMMLLKHQLIALNTTFEMHRRLDQTYNERFYDRDQRGPGYRRVYVILASDSVPEVLQAFIERAARLEPDDVAADLLGLVAAPLIRATTDLTQLQHSYSRLEEHYRQLVEAHRAMLERHHEAIRDCGILEGEKRMLQAELDLLRQQTQLLPIPRSIASLLSNIRRRLAVGRQLVRRAKLH